jgi:pectate lyase
MLYSHGTAFWIRRFRTLTAVRAAGKRASWASARGGFLVLLAFVAVAACETGVFDVEMGVIPASINLDVVDIDLISGRAAVIQAKVQDAKGKPINVGAGGVQIEWSSSDDWIASITPIGQATARVTGGAAGTAEITAVVHHTVAQAGFLALLQGSSNRGGIRASSSVHVRPANLVAVAGDGQSGAVGSTLPGELIVRAVDESGQGVPNVEIQFAAQPHNGTLDPGSAVTDQEGRARTRWTLGAAAGVMKAEAGAHNRYKLTPVEFTATALEDASGAASVKVTPTSAQLTAIGDTVQLTAVVRDADGNELSNGSVAWSSKDSSIAAVDAAGRVVARKDGRVRIVASVASVTDSALIDVEQVAASVTVSPTAATLSTGSTQQFSATVKDANGATISAPSLAWTSSNPTVATVDANGLVTGREAGSATLTAKSDDASGTASLTVNATAAPPPSGGLIPAFPGAEGWGATALNDCRDLPLVVHKVTNTNNSGAGSLRDVLENQVHGGRFDVVVFTTGGTISLNSTIVTNTSCLYVAGQTAPGDGIMIRSAGSDISQLLRVVTSDFRGDIVVRFLRFRHGFPSGESGGGLGAIGTGGGHDIIFDHISASWAGGSGHIQINRTGDMRPTVRTSMQNSIAAEGIYNRGMQYNATYGAGFYEHSFHRNLIATMGQRTPTAQAGDAQVSTQRGVEVVNNVLYNVVNRWTEGKRTHVMDYVKNYIDYGPHRNWERRRGGRWWYANANEPGSLYVDGNEIVNGNFTGTDWTWWRDENGVLLPDNLRRFTRLATAPFPITEMTATNARQWVLDNVGASRRLDCAGNWVWNRDEVDERIVRYVRDRRGPESAFQSSVEELHGGWPQTVQGTPCPDTDADGLPDAWEERFFGCATCADPAAVGRDGYLVMEHYLNGTNPR